MNTWQYYDFLVINILECYYKKRYKCKFLKQLFGRLQPFCVLLKCVFEIKQ